ncbi:MAG: energy transducer TonB [Candidatus Andeanibacterium colombiense]|uniref:Energy transducer TonB n=1 Tax=Candidatus Andeanibacterium colombiense TaxID=3121345 RepID=A0AAJ5XAZ2_9SPHN|nr:MAG: energy transducer TonB [Sphingomonadaceae bacterium]
MSTAVLTSSRNALGLRSDERIGLIVAGIAHVAIIAALAISALRAPSVVPPPERVTVNLSEDVGLDSTAAQVAPEAKASVSDRIGEEPTPPKPKAEEPRPAPPKPAPPKPAPPRPAPKQAPAKPVVSPKTSSIQPKPRPTTAPPPKKPGASRIGDNFLGGKGDKADANALVAASQIGSSDKASLKEAINRQIKPYWQPPSGAEADELRTYLAFDLNPDGSLAGDPRLVRQTGVTDANKPQASRHVELAIRAVRRAAPFDLPPKLYNGWKHITNWEFKWTPQ